MSPSIPSDGILPLHPAPATSPALEPDAAPAAERRRRSVPVEDRPYRILVVPPTPGDKTRAYYVARWQAMCAVLGAVAVVFVAGASIATVLGSFRTQQFDASSAELEALRGQLIAVGDSLSITRAALADVSSAGDSATTLATGSTSAISRARTRAALARRAAALRTGGSGVGGTSVEGLPVIGAIASGFSWARRHPMLHVVRPHLGLDVAARRGTRITAPASGRVRFVGRSFAFGNLIEIDHDGGIMTRYAHLGLSLVKKGDLVVRGTPIGTVGSSGLTTGPHLHYEILRNDRQVDPLRFHWPVPPADAVTPTTGTSGSGAAGGAVGPLNDSASQQHAPTLP